MVERFFWTRSELSLELQPKLLRVLQERQFERLGGQRVVDVDVRIVAATNRDLTERIAAGSFDWISTIGWLSCR
jgi:transcriptional regulator with GAF, ATPase, and Fis domain